jgi:hypothetical protein
VALRFGGSVELKCGKPLASRGRRRPSPHRAGSACPHPDSARATASPPAQPSGARCLTSVSPANKGIFRYLMATDVPTPSERPIAPSEGAIADAPSGASWRKSLQGGRLRRRSKTKATSTPLRSIGDRSDEALELLLHRNYENENRCAYEKHRRNNDPGHRTHPLELASLPLSYCTNHPPNRSFLRVSCIWKYRRSTT